ncbi:MAG: hypothetical protein ABI333_11290 [bacterium]
MLARALSVALTLAAVAPARAKTEKTLRWEAEVAAGLEYDSNATRLDSDVTEQGTPVQSGLFRGQGRLAASYRPASQLVLAASYDLAGKVFWSERARGQDAVIHRLTAALGLRLCDGLVAKLGGLYHEGFQRSPDTFDEPGAGLFAFRMLDGRLQLAAAPSPGLVAGIAFGARQFTYKPESALSFNALLAALTLESHHTLGKGKTESELDLAFAYSFSRRVFDSELELLCPEQIPGCAIGEPGQVVTYSYPGSERVDLLHRLSLEVTWVRGLLVSAGYELGISRSNSYGLGYQRHEFTAKLVTPLFWKIYGTLQIRARLLFYEASTVVLDDPGFEEENRSHALLQLERVLINRLRLVVRYTLFVGDLTSPDVASLRHLAYVGLSYRYSSK